MKRLISMILVFATLVALVACKKNKESEEQTSLEEQTTVEDSKNEFEQAYLENLPVRDFGGDEFYIFCTTQTENFYNIGDSQTNVIDENVFLRNKMVMDKYNVEFVYDSMDGNRHSRVPFADRVRNSVQADFGGYDTVVAQCYYMLPLATEGFLRDLNESTYLKLDMPWYNADINQNGVINGKLYGASGSYIMSQISYAMAIFFNKDMYASETDNKVDLYDLVREKKWTYEVLYEMTSDYYVDNNHDGQYDKDDRYGYAYNLHGIEASIVGSDVPIVEYDSAGKPTIDGYYNAHTVSVFEDYFDYYNFSRGVFLGRQDYDPARMLGAGNALFANAQLGVMVDCAELRNSEYDYGVLPYPLYNEQQENYLTYTMRWELFYILSNVDFERAAIVLEYLNYTSEKKVVPAYWDIALNTQHADTAEDSEMLYLIRDCLYYDFASFFGMEMGGIYRDPTGKGGIVTLIEDGNNGLAAWWNSGREAFRTSLNNVIEAYS